MRVSQLKEFFRLLSEQPDCKPELAKLRRFGLIALLGALASEIVMVVQLCPVKWIIDGLSQGSPKGRLYADCLLMLTLSVLGTRLNTAMELPRNRRRRWSSSIACPTA